MKKTKTLKMIKLLCLTFILPITILSCDDAAPIVSAGGPCDSTPQSDYGTTGCDSPCRGQGDPCYGFQPCTLTAEECTAEEEPSIAHEEPTYEVAHGSFAAIETGALSLTKAKKLLAEGNYAEFLNDDLANPTATEPESLADGATLAEDMELYKGELPQDLNTSESDSTLQSSNGSQLASGQSGDSSGDDSGSLGSNTSTSAVENDEDNPDELENRNNGGLQLRPVATARGSGSKKGRKKRRSNINLEGQRQDGTNDFDQSQSQSKSGQRTMIDSDPKNYFDLISQEESIFKKVERRYKQEEIKWNIDNAKMHLKTIKKTD